MNVFKMTDGTAGVGAYFPFEYRNGNLVQTSNFGECRRDPEQEGDPYDYPSKYVHVYADPECTEQTFRLIPGELLIIPEIYVNESKFSMHFQTTDGREGWMLVPNEFPKDHTPLLGSRGYAG